jgi:DNA-binding MarR family transcriptional regulator
MEQMFILEEQLGFQLRKAYQRYLSLFAEHIKEDLTPMQFAVLARLEEVGSTSQNQLGRLTAMDVATVKGVVGRLETRGLIKREPSPEDRRKLLIALTGDGHAMLQRAKAQAPRVTAQALAPLSAEERETLHRLLQRIT